MSWGEDIPTFTSAMQVLKSSEVFTGYHVIQFSEQKNSSVTQAPLD